ITTANKPRDELPSPSMKDKCEPLFQEEWSKIYPDELIIKWYYFPTAASKRVNTKQIKGIYYCKQEFMSLFGEGKVWGMTTSPCWWASDSKRGFRKNAGARGFYNVAVDVGDGTMKGFTTGNLHAFLAVLTRQCTPGVICREGFPW
ncbi:hypothetical protein PMAYCL1PPCAC_14972, partial [Pristionchus mayeri]